MCDTALPAIGAALLAAATIAAIAAAVTAIQLSHSLLFRGMLFFRRDTFDDGADAQYRRFTRSTVLFFALLTVAIVGSALATARCG